MPISDSQAIILLTIFLLLGLLVVLRYLLPKAYQPVIWGVPLAVAISVNYVVTNPLITKVLDLSFAIILMIAIYKLIGMSHRHYLNKLTQSPNKTPLNPLRAYFIDMLHRITRIGSIIGFSLYCIGLAGYNISAIIAGFGLGGFAIALAAKDTFANILGSITIALDQPFYRGDYIAINDIEGTVESIGLRSTQIRTPLDSLVTIPNATLTNTILDNRSKRQHRRVKFTLIVSHHTPLDKLARFLKSVNQIISECSVVRPETTHTAFTDFTDYGMGIYISYFLTVPTLSDEIKYKQAINYNIMAVAQDLGIYFAKPVIQT